MALNYPDFSGLSQGAGILAQPQTITNPLVGQNPMDAATLASMGNVRQKLTARDIANLKAAILREEPLNAQGPGPFGARQGVGPMGWATTIGDLVAGVIAKKKREGAGEMSAEAMAALSPAMQDYAHNFYMGAPGGLYDTGYLRPSQPQPVSQGSPLSVPLSF